MKLMKMGRAQSNPTTNSRPPKQQAQIVNLTAPLLPDSNNVSTTATDKRERKSNASQDAFLASTPGLAMHVPEQKIQKASRQSQGSAQKQQERSLQQLQKLRQDLLGGRKETIIATTTRKGLLTGDDAVRDEPPLPSPSPSSYSSMYNGAGAILKSPMSCLSTDQMLSAVDDKKMPSKESGGIREQEYEESALDDPPNRECIELETRQTSYISQMTVNTIKQFQNSEKRQQQLPRQSPAQKLQKKAPTERRRSITPTAKPIIVPYEPEFDMQKSLEDQLAKLPGSRPPGTSTKSFDEHSFIISSGTKPLDTMSKIGSKHSGQHVEHMSVVSIVPCDSYTPLANSVYGERGDSLTLTDTVVDIGEKVSQRKSSKLKRAPPEQRAETVKIDNGLVCVLPNNLKPKIQEILQHQQELISKHASNTRAKPTRGVRQQVGMVVEAKDLMGTTSSKRKSKSKDKASTSIGSRLKDIFQSQKDWTSLSRMNLRQDSQKKSVSGSRQQPLVSDVDDKWCKQSKLQESNRITQMSKTTALKEGKVDPCEISSSAASSAGKFRQSQSLAQGRNPEVVTSAQGKAPVFRIPSPCHQDTDSRSIELVASMTDRLKHKEQLASLAKEKEIGKKLLGDMIKNRSETHKLVQKPILRPLSSQITDGGSFCLSGSPSLETLNTYKMNEVVKKFAQEQFAGMNESILPTAVKNETPPVDTNGQVDGSEKDSVVDISSEKERRTSTALHDAKVAILFSLKHKIVNEIKKQKQREKEAIARGEPISAEEKERALNEVRRLHMRREQLQRVSESTIQKVFNKHLLATNSAKHHEENCDTVVKIGEEDNESDNDSGVNETDCRKNVTFAKTSRDSEDYSVTQSNARTSLHSPRAGLMSWTQCGIPNAAFESCSPVSPSKPREGSRVNYTRGKQVPMQALGAAALKTADIVASKSFMRAQAGIQKMKESKMECTSPEVKATVEGSKEIDTTESKEGKMNLVMSHSGSVKSEKSFETRDTRHTEYTERTDGTYDSQGSYGSYDSYDSYEYEKRRRSPRSPRKQSRSPRKQSRSPRKQSRSPRKQSRRPRTPQRAYRRYDSQQSLAGTEYTDDTFDDFGCQGGFWEPVAFR